MVSGDIFSFTKPGQPWFAWEWLTDVFFALLHNAMGLKGILLFGIIASAVFSGLLFRHMVWRGANLFIALPLTLMGFGSATIHLLARPHLWTMVLVAATAWWIQSDLRKPSPFIWLLVPLTALWTNLHGGWPALIALLGLTAVGVTLEDWSFVRTKRYLALAAACFSASILNPYGWNLHKHMAEYLAADWIKELVNEFSSPSFRGENMLQFEVLLLGSLLAVGLIAQRREFVGPLWVLFWAHSALVSARHIPLFVGVALPFLADELQRMWQKWVQGAEKKSTAAILDGMARESQPALSRTSVWAIIPFIIITLPQVEIPWPKDFPPERFPVKLVAAHEAEIRGARVFTEDQWADYLIYRFTPDQKVYFDGRSDFYGETLTREYCDAMSARHGWSKVLDKYGFTRVLLKPKTPLASVLKITPGWRVAADDTQAILFVRTQAAPGQG